MPKRSGFRTIERFGPSDRDELIRVWEASVRTTHHFLREPEIVFYRDAIRKLYLPVLRPFGIREQGRIAAFCAVAHGTIEMLFADPRFFGQGIGSRLVDFATGRLGAVRVDVNEENSSARLFYEHKGFRLEARDEKDPQDMPHPILHLVLESF